MAVCRSTLNTTAALSLLEVHSHESLMLGPHSVFSISPGRSSTHNSCVPMPFPSGERGFLPLLKSQVTSACCPDLQVLVRWLAGAGAAPAGDLGQVASWSLEGGAV